MILDENSYLMHYGILRRSGRYPWGSGGPENASNRSFLDMIDGFRRQGMTEKQIADGLGTTTTQLRAAKSIAKNEQKQADISMAQRLKDRSWSNVAIGKRMGINESSVRALLAPSAKDRADVLGNTSTMLKDQLASKGLIDIGVGVERQIGISKTKLATAVARLREEGYEVHPVKIQQLGTGKLTELKVLAPPGTTQKQVWQRRNEIKQIDEHSEDGGRSFLGVKPPISIKSKRVQIRYADQGGSEADGVIYVRPGVKDISLGGSRYSQVRIAIDGTHYIKGMAMYKDDLPAGVDLVFNTSKSNTGNKLDVMKPMQKDKDGNIDTDNPFGASIRQRIDPKTGKVISAMNAVGVKEGAGEEGSWETWSNSLSSQVLSKQNSSLARTQLAMVVERKQRELDEIMSLTNPAVRRKLLEDFADGADSASVHLKAAKLPRQSNHVILPIKSMKDNEVYAPKNFKNGERVVLIRHPHGGIFEIPELVVNNRNPEAKKLLGDASDAIGINHKVARRLSGADFDGDTVLVIPNNQGRIKTAPALAALRDFDPIASYQKYPGMKVMTTRQKGIEMGKISNLITDMTIRSASMNEIGRAVKHSMVVIDAEKHELNYKQSAIDNGIPQLMKKYQDKATGGAATLISKAGAEIRVPDRRARSASKGGPVDRTTGRKMFEPTGATETNRQGKVVLKTFKSQRLAEVTDAHKLSSGSKIETIYAEHSNTLKGLANKARREAVRTKTTPRSPSATTAYAKEVDSLNAKLNIALRNAPRERNAQVLGNATVSQKRRSNPDLSPPELRRLRQQALTEARSRTGAKKTLIDITDSEWAAIQAGAISHSKLSDILKNSDMDKVKRHATPKATLLMTSAKTSRARQMAASGYTQAEIADALGVSLTTLKTALS